MRKKHIIGGLFLLQIGIIGTLVFDSIEWGVVANMIPFLKPTVRVMQDKVTIMLPYSIDAFPLYAMDNRALMIMKNVYEPLVDFDENLHIKPVLAVSWGMLSPTKWEFTLRRDVLFHNKKKMDVSDILFSYNTMKDRAPADTKQLLETIQSMTSSGENKIIIETIKPDPLLLSKLRYFFILPSNLTTNDLDNFGTHMIGTGAYKWSTNSNGVVTLLSNDGYYKKDDVLYTQMQFMIVPKKITRLDLMSKKEVDVVVSLPSEALDAGKKDGYTMLTMPTLESVFLLANTRESSVFADQKKRELLSSVMDWNGIQLIVGNLGARIFQYAPSGVFGFNPDLIKNEHQDETASFDKSFVTMKVATANEPLGQAVATYMEKLNMKVTVVPESDVQLLEDVSAGNGDIFLLGWKFGDGDVSDFYQTIVHSRNKGMGQYNGLGYFYPDVDEKIEQAQEEITPVKRLKLLQEVMQQITQTYHIGMPLIESKTIYAVSPRVKFIPRFDGTITYHNFVLP